MALQRHNSIVASLAGTAVKINRPVLWYLFHPLTKLAQGDIDRIQEMSTGILIFLTHIHNKGIVFHKGTHIGNRNLAESSIKKVRCNQGRLIHHILCSSEYR